MSNLRTDYKDDVYTGNRKYHMNNNGDGTVSFTDETQYIQNGDRYGSEQINAANTIINNLDNNVYKSTDAAMTDIADNDYFPIYDTSTSTRKKTLWSTIKGMFTQTFAIKVHNSNSAGTYGAGTASYYGHVKLSDSSTTSAGTANDSVGASSYALCNAYQDISTDMNLAINDIDSEVTDLESELTANRHRIYMDYQNGKYGINTSFNRSADTFIPFSSKIKCVYSKGTAVIDAPDFGGVDERILTILISYSGDYGCDVGQVLETYTVENCTNIQYSYQAVHGDGQASLYIDGVEVAHQSSYMGDLTPSPHTITVRSDNMHHCFERGFIFTYN